MSAHAPVANAVSAAPVPNLAQDLAAAVEHGEVEIHYLPVIGLVDGAVTGVEALARWCPDDQVIEAEVFLELAERSGAIVAIGRHVVETACARVATWNAERPEPSRLRLSVNLSRAQAVQLDVVDHLAGVITASGLAPHLLCVEVGEATLRDLGDDAPRLLDALAGLGVRLAVDDFGTGATPLTMLQRHGIHELKVDRSIVARMDEEASSAALVRGIVALAQSLGLEVVAEGVERPSQEQMLRSLGCERAQGWLYARPRPDLDQLLDDAGLAGERSMVRRPPGHEEIWGGPASAGAAARFVEAVFEAAPIGMVLVDETGRQVAANPSAAGTLGHPVEDLTGRSCWELVHPADLEADLDGTDLLLRGEITSYRREQRVLDAGGVERWVEVTVSGIPGDHLAHGEAPRLLRQVRSIEDERRVGEDAALLRSIIEASPDSLVITDVTGRCTHWNRAAEQMFGLTAQDMVGSPLSRLVAPAGQMALARALGQAMRGRVERWPEADLVGADGQRRELDVIVGPVHDREGQVVGIVALGRDVSEQRAGTRALREAHAALAAHASDLSAVNERLGAFAATLTHDLLQPVAAVDGFLALLRDHADELTDEHRDWLARAIRGKERIGEAIEALHRAATEDEVELAPLAVGPAVEQVAQDLGLPAGSVDVADVRPVLVRADHGMLTRVVTNLLQNAARYRHSDRPLAVTVRCRPDDHDGYRTLVVEDDGVGIDQDELEAVFVRGVRGRAAGASMGTGTGLATVRSLVERMGGQVWAEHRAGGARICIRLRSSAPPET